MNKSRRLINAVSVVIPVFNERENVSELIKRLIKVLDSSKKRYEIIFIDDHSTDGTYEFLQKLTKHASIRVFQKQGKQGKAFSLIEGFSYAKYDAIAMIDADLQYPPEAIKPMIEKLKTADVVIANRERNEGSLLRRVLSRTGKFVFGDMFFGLKHDIQSGLKLFTKEVAETVQFVPSSGWTFDLEFLYRAKQAGFLLKSYDITFLPRRFGESKIHILKAGYEIGTNAIKVKTKHIRPQYISPNHSRSMSGAGVGFKAKKYITHTTLPYQHSALITFSGKQKIVLLSLLVIAFLAFSRSPILTGRIVISLLTAVYFIDFVFNLVLVIRSLKKSQEVSVSRKELSQIDDATLPMYTVLSPLYKEAHVIPQFVSAMDKIDWPKDKLDVMLLLEEDDVDTIKAVEKMMLPSYVRAIIVPDSQPKTKPKACNYGLAHAKGEYLVIYDAEDIPEPIQLKKAYLAFQQLPRNVICLQAKLNYYNPHDNLLTRFFTAEYSLWFDMTLPGLQGINATIPLGGTSNHFRTADLQSIQGWDPFNVTEDADLGVRLFKEGYKTAIIDSTTLEEANSKVKNWFRQRSRWLKGYMQTYLVHMRSRENFSRRQRMHTLYLQLTVGGKLAFILINPLLWVLTISYFGFRGTVGPIIEELYAGPVLYFAVTTLILGNFLFLYYYMIGCAKRNQWTLIKYIFLVPIYWLMLSIAAAMGFYQLLFKPHYWEKTVHGFHLLPKKMKEESTLPKTTRIRASFSRQYYRENTFVMPAVALLTTLTGLFGVVSMHISGVLPQGLLPWILCLVGISFALYVAKTSFPTNRVIRKELVIAIHSLVAFTTFSLLGLDILFAAVYLSGHEETDYFLISLVVKTLLIIGTIFSHVLVRILAWMRAPFVTNDGLYGKLLVTSLVLSIVFVTARFNTGVMQQVLGVDYLLLLPYISYAAAGLTGYALASIIFLHHLRQKTALFITGASVIALFEIGYFVLFHESIDAVVQGVFITGILQLLTMCILHLNQSVVQTTERNIHAMLMLFERHTFAPLVEQGRYNILIFNWRDLSHVWAGGAEVYIQEVAKHWIKDGNSVTIFCGNDGKSPHYQTVAGIKIIRLGGTYTVYAWAFLYYLLRLRGKFDVIIDCENGIPFFTPLYTRKPVFLLIHHIHQEVFRNHLRFPFSYIAAFLEGKCMPYVYKNNPVITVSESSRQEILKLDFVKEENIHIVHNGITRDKFSLSLKTRHPSFVYLGRLQKYKNVDVALKAFAAVRAVHDDATFAIVGWGECMQQLKKLTRKLDLEDAVTFYGKVSEKEKARILAKSWVAVQPSRVEGWGITVIEANSSGTPVIASRVNGLKDAVLDGKTGILAEAGNVKQFTEAMLVLAADHTYRKYLSDQAIVWSQSFNWDMSASLLFTIISESLAKRQQLTGQPAENVVFARRDSL